MMNYEHQAGYSSNEKLLFDYACRGDLESLRPLLIDGVSCRAMINGFNAMHMATKKGHESVLEALLEYDIGAISISMENGQDLLMVAAFEGHWGIVKLLHEKGIITSGKDNAGNNSLHFSTWAGHLEITKFLIENMNFSVVERNFEGMQPIHFCAAGNHIEIVKYLFEINENAVIGSDCNSGFGFHSLHRAAMYGAIDVVKFLLEKKLVEPDTRSSNGSTALLLATQHGRDKVVDYVLDVHLVDVNAQNNHGLSALFFACIAGHTDLVIKLVQKGASCNIKSLAGSTPLHAAAGSGRHDICEYFSEYDDEEIDFLAQDDEGATAIDDALNSGYKELASRLAFWSYLQERTEELTNM